MPFPALLSVYWTSRKALLAGISQKSVSKGCKTKISVQLVVTIETTSLMKNLKYFPFQGEWAHDNQEAKDKFQEGTPVVVNPLFDYFTAACSVCKELLVVDSSLWE